MASAPVFATTPRLGMASVTVTNTNLDGTGTIVDALTGVAAGTRIERVYVEATGDPNDSIVTVFVYNGSTYILFDQFDLGNPQAGTVTIPTFRSERAYPDLILPSASYKIAFAITAAPASGALNCWVAGADLT
jgi:hypothetical protein